MSFPYPAKPWQDGQELNVAMGGGYYLLGRYNESKNLWSFRRIRDDQVNREQIFTFDVLTTAAQPSPRDLSPFDTSDPTNLQTQQDVNWFLWNYIRDLELEGAQVDFSMEATLLEADPAIDETFERNPDEYNQYGNSLVYLNAPDHEDTTRIVLPKIDTEDFNWSTVLRSYGKGDVIMTVQVDDNGTPDNINDDSNFRSEWRIIGDPVENLYSFSYEVTHIKDMPDHLPAFGEKCFIRLIASQGADRPPIISDTEPTEHPKFPGEPLEEGDFWIDNHNGRAFTPMYYWTGTKWEELEHDENFDEDLKMHTCAQFFKKVASSNDVDAKEGHFCAFYDFGSSVPGEKKWWTSPPGKGFFNNGDKIYVNDQGPYVLEQLVDVDRWTTFFLPGSPQPPNGTTVKFSKIPKLCDTSFNDDRYVKKAGDTMTGTLEMKDANIDFVTTGESLKDGNGDPILVDDGQGNMVEQWDPANDRFRHIESLPPQLIKSDGTSGGDTKTPFGIRVEIDDGNTFKNQFKVGNRNGDAVTITGGGNPQVQFGTNFDQVETTHGFDKGVVIKGIPTPDREVTPGDYAVNKEYVDREDALLLNGLIDLQEEIEAIAPSLEKGAWEWDPNTDVTQAPATGKYFLLSGVSPTWTITDQYDQADAVVFHNTDSNGVVHGSWDSVAADKLILLFDKPDPDKCLGVVTQVSDDVLDDSVIIEFNRTEGFGKPNNNQDDNGKYITFVNIFSAPSGGDASEFVLKKGDRMTGELEFYKEQPDNAYNYNIPAAGDRDLRFATKRLDTNATSTTVLYKPGYTGALVCSGSFMARSSLYTTNYIYGTTFNSDGTKTTKNPRIYFDRTTDGSGTVTSEYGALRWGSSHRAVWNSSGGSLNYGDTGARLQWNSNRVDIPKPVNNTTTADGFVVRGATTNNNNYTSNTIGSQAGSLLVVKHVNNQPDHIEYRGKITESTDIVNKAYVDNNVNGNVINGNWNGNNSSKITITKSSGVYYISGG